VCVCACVCVYIKLRYQFKTLLGIPSWLWSLCGGNLSPSKTWWTVDYSMRHFFCIEKSTQASLYNIVAREIFDCNLQICVHSCTAFGIEDDLKPTSQHKRDDRPFSLADLRPSTLQPRRGRSLELRGSATNEVRLLQVASEHGGCWRYFYRALHTESFVGVISCVVRTIRCRHRCLTQICSVCVNCSNLDG